VSLADIAATLGATVQDHPTSTGAAAIILTGVTLRAAEVRPGDLFAGVAGSRAHGAAFVDRAVEAGAVALLTDPAGAAMVGREPPVPVLVTADPRAVLGQVAAQVYGRPSERLSVLGVTGTAGKTTTCYLLEAGLAATGRSTGLIGTVQTRIGDRVLPSAFTTPEAPDLQALFAVMLAEGVQAVAMEVSSHALAQGRVGGTHFAVGAFTNLSQDHLDFHHDMESYFRAKALLFDGRAAAGVIDIDDPYGARLAGMHPDAVTVSAAGNPAANWTVTEHSAGPLGVQHLRMAGPDGLRLTADLRLPGAFNVANALTAIACVHVAGLDAAAAAAALGSVTVPGRMQRVEAGQDFLAVVDYAHKPAAIAAVLGAVRSGTPGRIILVIGAGGDRDTGKRPMMGAQAVAGADLVIVTDDNPRSEDPAAIRAEVLAGAVGAAAEVLEIGDRRAAIVAAVSAARAGDAVVIAGKGHEQGQDVGGVMHPFSDADELAAALRGRGFDR
jgi:UDP-N-acetylmuramoyl-L-alanyl-D-glutamate--2,6-diaminopimelate ligase